MTPHSKALRRHSCVILGDLPQSLKEKRSMGSKAPNATAMQPKVSRPISRGLRLRKRTSQLGERTHHLRLPTWQTGRECKQHLAAN